MKNTLYIIWKYWVKHKKNAVAFLFSGVLLVAVVTVAFLQVRTNYLRSLHANYDLTGMYDILLPNPEEDVINQVTADQSDVVRSEIYALGKIGVMEQQYTYGWLEDTAGLLHIPMESGRMPSEQGEIAIDRGVLNQLNWVGKINDSIKLSGQTYTVVGILDVQFGQQRIATELCDMALEGDVSPTPIPLLYVAKPAESDAYAYRITMLDSCISNQDDVEQISEFLYNTYGENARWCELQDKSLIAADTAKGDAFRYDMRWLTIIAGIAAVIAVLSVFTVLRGIFLERQNNIRLLHRIGLSNRSIYFMYGLESVLFLAIQTVIGTVLGVMGYMGIFLYQVNTLNMADYSAFSNNSFLLEYTSNPFLIAGVFSVIIIISAYLITVLSTLPRGHNRSFKKHAGSLFQNFCNIFRQRAITVIQTVALTLICVGTMLGYIYYTDNGKTEEQLNHTKVYEAETYTLANGLDMKQDGVTEYYYVYAPNFGSIDSYGTGIEAFITADSSYTSGINDTVVAQFSDVIACGILEQTFLITDAPNDAYTEQILFSEQDEKDFIIQYSTEEYRDFFDSGQLGTKNLYRMETKLTNTDTIAKLSQYVVEGALNTERLNDGSEIILVLSAPNDAFKAGEVLNIGSALSNNGYGISDITQNDIKICAIAVIPEDAEICLRYAVLGDIGCNLLTTAQGAVASDFHNAVYTELLAASEIDGGKIPASSGMQRISYEQLRQDFFVEKATEYGGIILVIVLMSLLGFAAYFSGIGMKIRMKSYEISVLRALGTSISRIRRHLFLDSLKIPLIAAAAAGAIVTGIQHILARAYGVITEMTVSQSGEYLPLTEADDEKINEIIERYFIPNKCWVVSIEKPLAIIFLILCAVTVLLTILAMRACKGSIADTLNSRRERR